MQSSRGGGILEVLCRRLGGWGFGGADLSRKPITAEFLKQAPKNKLNLPGAWCLGRLAKRTSLGVVLRPYDPKP